MQQPWRNGGGVTREIGRYPEAADDWQWRLSLAHITADGPFSVFPGMHRQLTVLSGAGLRLRGADGVMHEVLPPHGTLSFAGEQPMHAELLDGSVSVFNLMWDRRHVEAQSWLRPMVGSGVLAVAPGEMWVVHPVAGCIHLADGDTELGMGDTGLLATNTDAGVLQRYQGAGAAIIIRLRVHRPAD